MSFIQRFGSTLNHHVHFHVIISDGVFSQADDGEISFHPAHGLTREIIQSVEQQVRPRILRYFARRGLLKEWAAREMLEWDHAGGFSLDASVHLHDWDRQGLERLVRYCARPPFAAERLTRSGDGRLVYSLKTPDHHGRRAVVLTPLEFLSRLSLLLPPPRMHRQRYHGVLAPHAKLRKQVVASAGPSGAMLMQLQAAETKMGLGQLPEVLPAANAEKPAPAPKPSTAWSKSWAMLLARIFEVLPLVCPRCREPMRITGAIMDPAVVEKILLHLKLPHAPPVITQARAPPQAKLNLPEPPRPYDDW